ncbi:MAG TPA: hypothetical protein PLB01_14610 [Thermoanaerobaculia bacterium]|nr:hypothetical protein [Thermoanaerobaculia bacterium]
MTGPTAAALVLLFAAAPPLPFAARVDGARAVERARYAFVLDAAKPFDDVYPRSVFEKMVTREAAEEDVLRREFGMEVTRELLAAEYDRIEKETRAPDQWEAMKKALGNDRGRVEQVVCRPLLVDRALRARFAFDAKIHAAERQKARDARNAFLGGGKPAGAERIRLSRRASRAGSTDDMLAKARADAAGPKLLSPGAPKTTDDGAPLPVDPEMAQALEKELKAKGDVTTILEERGRFSVFRLVTAAADEWLVDGVRVPKRDFEKWIESRIGTAR